MRKKLNVSTLDKHIAKLEETEKMLEGLQMDLEPIQRYLGGLRMARELVTGEKPKDAQPVLLPMSEAHSMC